MFKADVKDFVGAFNMVLDNHYGEQDIPDVAEGDAKAEGDAEAEENPHKVHFGDLLYPCYKKDGEFQGFRVRAELARTLYLDSKFKPGQLKRILTICIFINKMMKFGGTSDFAIKHIQDGQGRRVNKGI